MKGLQLRFVVGSSLCLASVPAFAFAGTHQPLVKRMPEEPNPSGDGLTPTDFIPQHQGSQTPSQSQHLYQLRLRAKQAGLPSTSNSKETLIDGEAYLLTRLQAQRRATAPKVRLRYVTVQSGDTLWGIARRYKVPLSSLEQWNHLSVDSLLHIGQKIQLFSTPGGSTRSQQVRHASLPSTEHVSVKAAVQTRSSLSQSKSSLSSRHEPAVANMASGVFGMQVVKYAERFLGVPYRWAGESPSTGFDCSGLVQFVFAHFGVSIARSSYEQFQTGSVAYRSSLLPGDLVFFDTDGPGASHVGIYVGNQRFISASGTAVSISSLTQSYWADHYLGARRIRP